LRLPSSLVELLPALIRAEADEQHERVTRVRPSEGPATEVADRVETLLVDAVLGGWTR
jgi:hypothetical protein